MRSRYKKKINRLEVLVEEGKHRCREGIKRMGEEKQLFYKFSPVRKKKSYRCAQNNLSISSTHNGWDLPLSVLTYRAVTLPFVSCTTK